VRILSLGRLVADALVDFTNFDSRIWRSLVTLTFKPGRLTSAYVAGQRARYAPPFRMYVVTSVAFFVAFSLTRLLSSPPNEPVEGAQIEASVNATVDAALAEAGLAPQRLGPPGRAVPDAPEPDAATVNPDYFNLSRDDDGSWECDFDQKMEPQMRARLEAACRKIENDSGASFVRAFADNFPVMMLVFIPLVAAIMKVLYLFARRKYVEHLLFFLHVHTFFFSDGARVDSVRAWCRADAVARMAGANRGASGLDLLSDLFVSRDAPLLRAGARADEHQVRRARR
jgi:hypothetical protein